VPGGRVHVLESLVDLRVDARDEERRDRVHVERLALLVAALEPADVGLRHLLVLLDLEQQRDVDVQALVGHLLDRRQTLVGAGDLDHQVGPVDAPPVLARLLHRALRVERDVGIDLERDVAVVAVGLVVDRAQHVGGVLDVLDRDRLVDGAGVGPLVRQLLDLLVVVLGAEDRLLEDRGIGGLAAQGLLAHESLEFAAARHRSPDLIQPDARPRGGDRRKPFVHRRFGCHVSSLRGWPEVRRARSRPPCPAAAHGVPRR
jgi:hypothetical protein